MKLSTNTARGCRNKQVYIRTSSWIYIGFVTSRPAAVNRRRRENPRP
jgi:hypothetical protein